MITIRLFCNAGMSTSLLVEKMKQAAKEKEIQVDIEALPINEINEGIAHADVVLLGPQVSYVLKKTTAICSQKGIPVGVIPMQDYGMCNGASTLEYAMKFMK